MPSASKESVEGFLNDLRKAVSEKRIVFLDRAKNKEALKRLGFNKKVALSVLKNLSAVDYARGPEDPHDGRAGQIWVFGSGISGLKVYIKIHRLLGVQTSDWVCISFHEEEEGKVPLTFPFRSE